MIKRYFIYGIIFLVPRLIRMLYHKVWLEDTMYLYAGFAIKNGLVPYRDFAHFHPPLLEFILSIFYRIFGTTYLTAEILTQSIVFIITFLIFIIGRRIKDEKTGLFAGLIFANSSLVFRYHIFGREIFTLFFAAIIIYMIIKWHELNFIKIIIISLLFVAGALCKFNMGVTFVAVIIYLVIIKISIKNTLSLVLITSGLFAVIFAIFYLLIGFQVFVQVFMVHFVKGTSFPSLLHALLFPTKILDITLAFGISGLFFLFLDRPKKVWLLFVIYLACYIIFLVFLNPTAWPHNYIDTLLPLSLLGGLFVAGQYKEIEQIIAAIKLKTLIKICLPLTIFIILILFFIPIKNLNWVFGSSYGFGYLLKKDISEVAKIVKENTTPDDLLILPSYLAVESQRRDMVSELKTLPILNWVEKKIKVNGLFFTLGSIRDIHFKEAVRIYQNECKIEAMPYILEGKIKMIVQDIFVEDKDFSLSPTFLVENNYRLIFKNRIFMVFSR